MARGGLGPHGPRRVAVQVRCTGVGWNVERNGTEHAQRGERGRRVREPRPGSGGYASRSGGWTAGGRKRGVATCAGAAGLFGRDHFAVVAD